MKLTDGYVVGLDDGRNLDVPVLSIFKKTEDGGFLLVKNYEGPCAIEEFERIKKAGNYQEGENNEDRCAL